MKDSLERWPIKSLHPRIGPAIDNVAEVNIAMQQTEVITFVKLLGIGSMDHGIKAALQAFSNNKVRTSDLIYECKNVRNSLLDSIVLQWIPAHCGIERNERADFLAKKGTTILDTSVCTLWDSGQLMDKDHTLHYYPLILLFLSTGKLDRD
ncbi:hypothetical protein TNCV_1263301 [Trichonephila clavipes]|nr:hypothetical protein TNCV_1263301 [Trichonephila clavipes]